MPAIRLYVFDNLSKKKEIDLDQKQSHYITCVMRQKEGNNILLFNGKDGEWLTEITYLDRKKTRLKCTSLMRTQSSLPDIWLLFAILKKKPMAYLVEKATELGCPTLIPLLTDLTTTRQINLEKLKTYTIEAAEQCHGLSLPQIHPVIKLYDLLRKWDPDRKIIFCDETRQAPSLVTQLQKIPLKNPKIALLIGPEGGFSSQERKDLQLLDHTLSSTLGPRILRAETAAITALGLSQAILGDWNHKTG